MTKRDDYALQNAQMLGWEKKRVFNFVQLWSTKNVSTLFQLFDRDFSEYMITMYGVLVLTMC